MTNGEIKTAIHAMRNTACRHEEGNRTASKWDVVRAMWEDSCYCTTCDSLLYINWQKWEKVGEEIKNNRECMDDIYWLLYTRRGRLRLLRYYMEEVSGLTAPDCWKGVEP